jgi:hypothetical protein
MRTHAVNRVYSRDMTFSQILILGACTLGVVLPQAQLARTDGPASAIRDEVQALHAEMIAAFREKPANVASYYASDARILGGGGRYRGNEIASYWSQIAHATSWSLDVLDAGGSRDEPWVLGRSTLTLPSGQRMVTDYLAILRRDANGKLEYYIDMFTSAAR